MAAGNGEYAGMRFDRVTAWGVALAAMLAAALPAAAQYGEANITTQTTMRELRANQSIEGSGIFTYGNYYDDECELSESYYIDKTLEEYVGSYSAAECARGLNLAIQNYNSGRQVTYKVYTAQEIAAEPDKDRAELYYFPAEQAGAKYALVVGGNNILQSGELKEGIAAAGTLHDMGYAVFVLRYRAGLRISNNAPLLDLGAAVQYITANADEFGVQAEDYAIVGYSAGGHISGLFGSAQAGYGRFGVPKPACLLLAYPVNDYFEVKPVYHALFDADSDDWRFYWSNVSDFVTSDYPPTYLWYGQNDITLNMLWLPAQCETLAKALESSGVKHKLVRYQNAPHAIGVGAGTDSEGWLYDAVAFWQEQAARSGGE